MIKPAERAASEGRECRRTGRLHGLQDMRFRLMQGNKSNGPMEHSLGPLLYTSV